MIHRDLKLDNLLIHFPDHDNKEVFFAEEFDLREETFEVKIADFGLSRELEHDEMA